MADENYKYADDDKAADIKAEGQALAEDVQAPEPAKAEPKTDDAPGPAEADTPKPHEDAAKSAPAGIVAEIEADAAKAGTAYLAELKPEFAALGEHVTEPAITFLKEAGNKGLQALEQYGPEELSKLEAAQPQVFAVFTSVHNKLATLLAALEALYAKG